MFECLNRTWYYNRKWTRHTQEVAEGSRLADCCLLLASYLHNCMHDGDYITTQRYRLTAETTLQHNAVDWLLRLLWLLATSTHHSTHRPLRINRRRCIRSPDRARHTRATLSGNLSAQPDVIWMDSDRLLPRTWDRMCAEFIQISSNWVRFILVHVQICLAKKTVFLVFFLLL